MALAGILILSLFIASGLLLVLSVLIQDDQGEGIGSMFGGGESSSPFGSRTGNVLTKFTSILGAVFLICAFALAWINRTPERGDILERSRLQSIESEAGEWWIKPVSPSETSDSTQAQGSRADSASAKQGASEGTIRRAEASGNTSGGGSSQ